MATEVKIPKLAISMTEGTLLSWLVEDGQTVSAGDPLYVLETDKVETEIQSPDAGVARLLGSSGEVYPIGALIAEIV